MALRASEGLDLAGRLHVLPDFHGNRSPLADPHALGVISGLTLDASFDSLCRLYWRTAVGDRARRPPYPRNAEGAAASSSTRCMSPADTRKNPLLMELYADAVGCTVIEPLADEAVLLGTGMVAATAAGLYPDLARHAPACSSAAASASPTRGARALRPRLPDFPGNAPAEAGARRDGVAAWTAPRH